jgi:hypothetical protein
MQTISEFVENYDKLKSRMWWEPLDRPIIQLCDESPQHEDVEVVFAKVALVNRVYRTNIQMSVKNAEWALAETLVHEKVDRIILPLRPLRTFGPACLEPIRSVHEKLVQLVRRVTKRFENSFCSKYLSFHFPEVVPIFDNFAYRAAWSLCKGIVPWPDQRNCLNANYRWHTAATFHLWQELARKGFVGERLKLKLIDYVLYSNRPR